ncbi:hypothetical protein GWI33_001510 [Rhynchophorus ferrugineus]|uniref:Venom serine protease 34 n=1 Tax=Rhynchophorus ferrugineus TaxID=354439 RepID=A0A834ILP6_RHYFE|nr:hypothetical protein GWI33_001510 [Rhynchophorus ferrugineus]
MWDIFNFLMPVSMVVNVVDPNCVFYQEMLIGEQYYIYNREYPQNYSTGASCKWVAVSPPNSKIFLSCKDVIMPKTTNCRGDHLAISSNGQNNLTETHRYCGEGSFSLITKDNSLSITLFTTTQSEGGRFLCSITSLKDDSENELSGFGSLPVQTGCQCGWRNERRIVGGQETGVNEYPAMAGLIDRNSQPPQVYCGSTIISNKFVISAAHCTYNHDPRSLLVLVGEHNVDAGADTDYTALYNVIAYEMHPRYNPSNQANDIAIIQTDRINFNDNVGPICLPFRYTYDTFQEEKVTMLGWGQLEFSGMVSSTLQEVSVDVISNVECGERQSEAVNSNEICTYTEGKDSCQSDSGGPLLWQNQGNKRLFLVGIISHGIGCASGFPGVNVRVTAFLEWIQSRTNEYFCSI